MVFHAYENSTNNEYAVKVVPKSMLIKRKKVLSLGGGSLWAKSARRRNAPLQSSKPSFV